MKKTYLAAAAILGAAIFAGEAHAVKITYGDGKSFKMGFRAKINATYRGERNANDKSDLVLSVPNSRIYAKGSISKIFKWTFQGDMRRAGVFQVVDTYITLDFAKEFRVVAGWIKLPFELHSGIQSGWSFIMPTGPSYGLAANPFGNPDNVRAPGSGSRSPIVGVWGKVADGVLKYYVYITDGTDETNATRDKTGYGARIELSPTMMGYKGHPGYVLKETYLGKQNTLSLGVSYYTKKIAGQTANSWGLDLMWEQNFGAITPTVTLGYVSHKDYRGTNGDDRNGLIVQGQILFNQKTMLGKPAVAARWAQSDPDQANGGEKSSVLGAVAQLYVKGVGNRIALSIDRVTNDRAGTKDYTDITLAFWYNF